MTTETKLPQPGEYWLTRGGERRYVWAKRPEWIDARRQPVLTIDATGYERQHNADGQYLGIRESDEDLIKHLPWCHSFDDVEPVAETVNPKDFPEDAVHENGNYTCQCGFCGCQFTGHKRRVACKECVPEPLPESALRDVPSTPDPGEGWRLLEYGEVINDGDEVWFGNDWSALVNVGDRKNFCTYRRRITPVHPLGPESSEPDTVPIQFMVPRRILDGGDWPVRAVVAGGVIESAATWLPVTIDRLGDASVRRAVQE